MSATKTYPNVKIDGMENSEEGIEVEISVTVDTTDASENLKKANEDIQNKLIEELGFEEADSKSMFITSMPTTFPTRIPTGLPTTTVPTSRPSITGAIISIELEGKVTQELSSEDLTNITETVKAQYGISDDEVQIETTYKVSGVLNVTIPKDVPEEEALEAIENSLSELLGVHPSQIDLRVDENGDVVYVITSDSYDGASDIQQDLDVPEFVKNLEMNL